MDVCSTNINISLEIGEIKMRKSDDGKDIILTYRELFIYSILIPGVWLICVFLGVAIVLPYFI